MYQSLENKIGNIKEHILLFNTACLSICLVCFYLETRYIGSFNDQPLWRHIGGALGEIGVFCIAICFCYYLLREVYIRNRKRKGFFLFLEEGTIKEWLRVLRLVHPLVGVIMFYVILFHGINMLEQERAYPSSVYIFGIVAVIFSFILMLIGININRSIIFRQYHRVLSAVLILAVLGHVFLRF